MHASQFKFNLEKLNIFYLFIYLFIFYYTWFIQKSNHYTFCTLRVSIGYFTKKCAQLAGTVEYTDCTLCLGYNTKLSDGEVPVMVELWGMWSTPSLPWLQGSLCPGVVAPDKGPNRTKLRTYAKLNCLKWNCFWHLTVCKQKLYLY